MGIIIVSNDYDYLIHELENYFHSVRKKKSNKYLRNIIYIILMNTLPTDIKSILISYNKINLNDRHPLAIIMKPSIEYYNNTESDWLGWSYSTWIRFVMSYKQLELGEKSLDYLRWKRMKIIDFEYTIIDDEDI